MWLRAVSLDELYWRPGMIGPTGFRAKRLMRWGLSTCVKIWRGPGSTWEMEGALRESFFVHHQSRVH